MAKTKKKAYASKVPGLRLTLPPHLIKELDIESVNYPFLSKNRQTLKFSNKSPDFIMVEKREMSDSGELVHKIRNPIVETDDSLIQKFIESHGAFKSGVIYRIESAAERAQKELQKAQQESLAKYRKLTHDGLLRIDEQTPYDTLLSLSKEVGIETAVDGKKAKKETLIKELSGMLGIK